MDVPRVGSSVVTELVVSGGVESPATAGAADSGTDPVVGATGEVTLEAVSPTTGVVSLILPLMPRQGRKGW